VGTRILVVDDEDTLRSVIAQVLTQDGHEVSEAPSAERGLELFRESEFPLVITDIIMAGMSGLDLLDEVKRLNPDTVVVVMTSHASLETATAALRSGAYDFLIKPFEDIDLVSAVVNRAADRIRLIEDNRELVERLKSYAAKLEALNAQLHAMATRDGLTGLYNHRYFREALDRELSRAHRHERPFSVVLMDIDHFKHYNDTHGHLAGDSLLTTFGEILQQRCRESTVVARYGGEEFVLLVPETDEHVALQFAESIRKQVEQYPFEGR
jgi:diguanylate cyclase (GGDEF)-like protein